MDDNNRRSNEIALETLEKTIKKLAEEGKQLENIVNECRDASNAIIEQYSRLRNKFSIIEEKYDDIASLDKNYGFKLLDDLYKFLDDKYVKTENDLKVHKPASSNKFVRFSVERLQKKLERLGKMRGKIDSYQCKIVNFKLKMQIGFQQIKTKNEVVEANLELFSDKYIGAAQEKKEKAADLWVDKKPIRAIISYADSFISYAKYGVLWFGCKTLKIKNGLVSGACQLPGNIAQKIKETIAKKKKNNTKK